MGRMKKSKLNKVKRMEFMRAKARQMRENNKKSKAIKATHHDETSESESPPSLIKYNQQQSILASQTNIGQRASTSGVQLVEVPQATELGTEGPDVIKQQPTSEIAEVVEEPKPLPKLRQRRPPPMTSAMSTRSSIRVAAGDKERLAGLVRGHPVLYNTHYAHFTDKAQRHYAWQDISRRMLRPDTECIAIWKLLKSSYSQALRRRKQRMELGIKIKHSKYESFMSFVKPFLKVCNNAPVTTATTDEAPSEGSVLAPEWIGDASSGPLERSSAPSGSSPRSGCVPALPEQPQRNTIVELFRNLGETVKDFPKDVKIRVKSEVLKVVSDAREFILSNNTVEQLFVVEDIRIKEEPLELQ